MDTHFDIAIIGSGPAGASAAIALKDSGLSVALFDKAAFPRDKICGDAIGGRAKKVMKGFSNDFFKDLDVFEPKNTSAGWKMVAPNGKTVEVNFVNSGYVSKRIDFDWWLYGKAADQKNVRLITDHELTDVISTDEKIKLISKQNQFTASLVIGCDGAHSVVAKRLSGFKVDHRHYSAAVRAYYKNVKGTAGSEMLEIHLVKGFLPGYFWIFPLKNNLSNVGFGMLSEDVKKRKIDLKTSLKEIIESSASLSERFQAAELIGEIKGFGLPLGGKRRSISGNRFMLCGDAASLIDPLTGEGIGNAMLSGVFAAKQAIECFGKNDFSANEMKNYEQAVYKKLLPELRKNLFIQRTFNQPRLINMMVNLGDKFPAFKNWVAKKL